MSPLTWTEPEQSGARICALATSRVALTGDRVEYATATPSDIAAALNAAGADVVREMWHQLTADACGYVGMAHHDLAAALKRAEAAERERGEARAKLECAEAQRDDIAKRWADEKMSAPPPVFVVPASIRAELEQARAELAALRDERRFALVCAALVKRPNAGPSDHAAAAAIRDADATLALLTTPVQPATPALSPDDAAELEAYRAMMRWTQGSIGRGLRVERNGAVTARHSAAIDTVSESVVALAAKLGAK